MFRSWTLVLAVVLLPGCRSKPRVEREPERYVPAESDARRITRLRESVDDLRTRVEAWIAEVDAHRAGHPEDGELALASEGLREVRDRLERLRSRVHGPPPGGSLDDIEREVLRLAAAAEKNHERALRAVERR